MIGASISKELVTSAFKSSSLKIAAIGSFKMLVPVYQTRQCYTSKDHNLDTHCCKNIISQSLLLCIIPRMHDMCPLAVYCTWGTWYVFHWFVWLLSLQRKLLWLWGLMYSILMKMWININKKIQGQISSQNMHLVWKIKINHFIIFYACTVNCHKYRFMQSNQSQNVQANHKVKNFKQKGNICLQS